VNREADTVRTGYESLIDLNGLRRRLDADVMRKFREKSPPCRSGPFIVYF
jgi:hypothetical protein